MILRYLIGLLFLLCLPALSILSAELPQKKSSDRHKIVLIAGPKSHGPVGNGIHDYPWSVKLLKVMLDNSNIRDKVQVEYHLEGWPENPETLNYLGWPRRREIYRSASLCQCSTSETDPAAD